MINHHPNSAILQDFVDGNLADSVSLIVASHVELCEHCRKQVSMLTAQAADSAFESDALELKLSDSEVDAFLVDEGEFDFDAINQITADLSQAVEVAVEAQQETVYNTTFTIPRALNSVVRKDWMNLGKISRARLDFDDESHHTSLLHIDKDGQVPCHTHKGFEITLLLEGSFEDEMGVYNKGDFIWLDGEHTHQPATKEGCVCLTVSSDALYFTKGVSQLFNPLGRYIY